MFGYWKKYIQLYRIVGLLVCLMTVAAGIVIADEAETVTPEQALLALINEARHNPLEMAASMGLDPDRILADLPELENILINGIPPLAADDNLSEAAFAHTWDMFARGYYSSLTPDGLDYEDRIVEAGYPAVLTGESLGMILFANFINPEDAARLIFEYMFADELDPTRTEKRNILDPCLRAAGISIQTGTLALRNGRWNVYLATCDFGSLMTCPEGVLFDLINQARVNPVETMEMLGMDVEQWLLDYPQLADFFEEGVFSLSFDNDLTEAARAHAADMLENGFFNSENPDGLTPADRIEAAGYADDLADEQSFEAGEQIWRACLGKDDGLLNDLAESDYDRIRALIGKVFTSMFTCALRGVGDGEENLILGESFSEIGPGMAAGICPEFESICGDRILLLVMDFGRRPEVEDTSGAGSPTE